MIITGRIDANGTWKTTLSSWLNMYRNREIIDSLSIMKEVRAENEWCAEAYLETYYERIIEKDLITSIKKYFLNNVMLMNGMRTEVATDEK